MWRSLGERFRGPGSWSLEGVPRPWGTERSILALLRHGLVGGRVPRAGIVLPSDTDERLKWAPGALDGVLGHHAGPGDHAERAAAMLAALRDLEERPGEEPLARVNALATSVLPLADPLSDLVPGSGLRPERVAAIGRVLAYEGTRAEPVKLGIVLIGLAGDLDADREPLTTLGIHEEFTLFVALALARLGAGERGLWDLARRVHGWGRIQIVERLAGTSDPHIRDWLLRDGFRNEVMDEYLAWTAAVAGRLDEALHAAEIDEELFLGAADILRALATGGPARDLSDYEPAPTVVADWLRHARARIGRGEASLPIGRTLAALADHPALPGPLDAEVAAAWRSPEIRHVVQAGLESTDSATFNEAVALARTLDIDVFEALAAQLVGDAPKDGYLLFTLFQDVDEAHIDRALDVARAVIDLDAVATGPGLELGLGARFAEHGLLDSVLPPLRRFPGRGTEFVLAGLRSPVIRNRNAAVSVLMAWGEAAWPPDLVTAAESAVAAEPDRGVTDRLFLALSGGSDVEP